MALSLQDEDSVLQLLHGSLKQVVLLHHGAEAMLQLSLSVRQHFDLQRDESWCWTPYFPGSVDEGNHVPMREMKQKKNPPKYTCMHSAPVCRRKTATPSTLKLARMKLATSPGPSLPVQMVGFSSAWMLESTGRAPELPVGLCNALPACFS